MTAALELREVEVHFGGIAALAGVSLTVEQGELVGLIGPNGAGKTTLIDAVTGFARYQGSIVVAGECVDALRPDLRVAAGVARTFQSVELFDDLTVRENVAVGPRGSMSTVDAALVALDLLHVAERLPTELPASTCRFVGLARALASGPRVLLLDEVAAGMDGSERAQLAARLRALVAAGTAVLMVDHDLGLVADVSHRVVALAGGRVIANGSAEDVRHDRGVLAAYLGPRA